MSKIWFVVTSVGRPPIQMVKDHYASKLATWAEWEHVSLAAHG
jgi:hypothetical protein